MAYIGSGGAVEIAVRDGSAARRLGIGVGGRVARGSAGVANAGAIRSAAGAGPRISPWRA